MYYFFTIHSVEKKLKIYIQGEITRDGSNSSFGDKNELETSGDVFYYRYLEFLYDFFIFYLYYLVYRVEEISKVAFREFPENLFSDAVPSKPPAAPPRKK